MNDKRTPHTLYTYIIYTARDMPDSCILYMCIRTHTQYSDDFGDESSDAASENEDDDNDDEDFFPLAAGDDRDG